MSDIAYAIKLRSKHQILWKWCASNGWPTEVWSDRHLSDRNGAIIRMENYLSRGWECKLVKVTRREAT